MLAPETLAAIDRLVYEEGNASTRLGIVAALDSCEALQRLAHVYNWDDGFEVPTAIADHPKCDLGLALNLFWLADGISWFNGEIVTSEYNREWVGFCDLLTSRILAGHYLPGPTSFKVPLGLAQRHQLKEQGVPAPLISDIEGDAEVIP